MTKSHKNPPDALDEIATSIKELILNLENRERDGRHLTAVEIDFIASKLQTHVEELLAASKNRRDH